MRINSKLFTNDIIRPIQSYVIPLYNWRFRVTKVYRYEKEEYVWLQETSIVPESSRVDEPFGLITSRVVGLRRGFRCTQKGPVS